MKTSISAVSSPCEYRVYGRRRLTATSAASNIYKFLQRHLKIPDCFWLCKSCFGKVQKPERVIQEIIQDLRKRGVDRVANLDHEYNTKSDATTQTDFFHLVDSDTIPENASNSTPGMYYIVCYCICINFIFGYWYMP